MKAQLRRYLLLLCAVTPLISLSGVLYAAGRTPLKIRESTGTVIDKRPAGSEKDKKEAALTAYVDKSMITIGDKIKYTLALEADKDMDIDFPHYIDNLGGFAVRDFRKEKPLKAGRGRIKIEQWYILDTFTTGSYVIPSQHVGLRSPLGEKLTLESPEIFVEVKSVIGDSAKDEGLRDIKDPVSLRRAWKYFIYAALIIVFAVLVFLLLKYIRGRSGAEDIPYIPPEETALSELERIESLKLIEDGFLQEYYYLVSAVLRKYLEDRYLIRAPEQTTEEFISSASNSEILSAEHIELLKEYLVRCDMVKYARYEPDISEAYRLIDTTRAFVNMYKEEQVDLEEKTAGKEYHEVQ